MTSAPNCPHCGAAPIFQSSPAQEVDETERLRRATMDCVDAMRAWIVPDGISADEAMQRIVGALDNPEINPIILEADNARS